MGSTSPEMRFLGLFFDFPRLQREKRRENEEIPVQQSVPGYDPQLVAMHTLPLAARLPSTARGSSPEP